MATQIEDEESEFGVLQKIDLKAHAVITTEIQRYEQEVDDQKLSLTNYPNGPKIEVNED